MPVRVAVIDLVTHNRRQVSLVRFGGRRLRRGDRIPRFLIGLRLLGRGRGGLARSKAQVGVARGGRHDHKGGDQDQLAHLESPFFVR